ncbi:hypothetical protein [Streptomyces sp. NPDC056683]|uniref:hypothetical protein n=1 Tax=Streptomyces sp. NPDC056683 TaxID=3345910 RepID=UPI003692AEA5
MTSSQTGRDGRPLVVIDQAAYWLGTKTPGQFRERARRRGITPAGWRKNPTRGQVLALWDLADINDAVCRQSVA